MTGVAKTRVLCAVVLAGLAAAILFHAFVGLVLGVPYPGDTFLYDPTIRFSDFYWIFEPTRQGSPLSGKWSLYPPFAYLPLFPLVGLSWPVAYAVVLAVFVPSLVWFFWRRLDFLPRWQRIGAATVLPLLSVGTMVAIDRGNLDQIAMVFILAFFGLFARGRYLLSAVPLAAAIATKIYPGAFGVLLLLRRQYAAAALVAVLTIVLTAGAAALLPGGVAGTLELLRERSEFLEHTYVLNPTMHQNSLSYFSLIKIACRVLGVDFAARAGAISFAYAVATAALFAMVVGYVLLRERVLWKQAYLLAFLVMVIPQVSFDYKLMNLLPALAFFIATPSGRRRDDLLHVALFGLLLIPKAYFPFGSETKIGGILNPLALTVMAGHIMWTGLRRGELAGGRGFGRDAIA